VPLPGVVQRGATSLLYRPTGLTSPLHVLDRVLGHDLERAVAGKVVVVTGASSGIGRETAIRLGAAGAKVLLIARNRERLEEVAEIAVDRGGEAELLPCDLGNQVQLAELATELRERGDVAVLINNAGHSIRRSIELSYDRIHDFERTIELNYLAAVQLVLAVLPGMRRRRSGQVINVTTAGVHVRGPRFSAYTASKTALDAFSDCVGAEVAEDGVRVTKIEMPLVRTPMIEPSRGAYRGMPSIGVEQAAEMLTKAIVYRPRRIGTAAGDTAALLNVLAPWAMEAARKAGYRLSEDSEAARGANDGTP
jgi:short-subunit dehydrogenase